MEEEAIDFTKAQQKLVFYKDKLADEKENVA
jgi:hypothetical protein